MKYWLGLGLTSVLTVLASPSLAQEESKLLTTSCYQGHCQEEYWTERSVLIERGSGVFYNAFFQLNTRYEGALGTGERTLWVNCSLLDPFVAFEQVDQPGEVYVTSISPGTAASGADSGSHQIYWNVCHEVQDANVFEPEQSLEGFARQIGYSLVPGTQQQRFSRSAWDQEICSAFKIQSANDIKAPPEDIQDFLVKACLAFMEEDIERGAFLLTEAYRKAVGPEQSDEPPRISFAPGGQSVLAKQRDCAGDSHVTDVTRQTFSMLIGFVPLVGTAVDWTNAITGVDLITGEELEWWERTLSVVPYGRRLGALTEAAQSKISQVASSVRSGRRNDMVADGPPSQVNPMTSGNGPEGSNTGGSGSSGNSNNASSQVSFRPQSAEDNYSNGVLRSFSPSRTEPSGQPGGTPSGTPEVRRPQDGRGYDRQLESADVLAQAGYDIRHDPMGASTQITGKRPDYLIEGYIFDSYAPSTDRPRNIWDEVKRKVKRRQANRLVINLDDSAVDMSTLREQFADWPVDGLEEVITIRNGNIEHLFP